MIRRLCCAGTCVIVSAFVLACGGSGGGTAITSVTTPTTPSTGTVVIKIIDATGNLVPGATYSLVVGNSAVGDRVSTTGQEIWSNQPSGPVSVTATKSGYTTNSAAGTIVAGGTTTLPVAITTTGGGGGGTGTVVLRFKDGAGNGLQNVTYTLTYPGGSQQNQIGSDGVSWSPVPAGTIGVSASKTGYTSASTSGTLTAGGTLPLTVTMNASGSTGSSGGNASWVINYGGTSYPTSAACFTISTGESGRTNLILSAYYASSYIFSTAPEGWEAHPTSSWTLGSAIATSGLGGMAYYDANSGRQYETQNNANWETRNAAGPGTGTVQVTSFSSSRIKGSYTARLYNRPAGTQTDYYYDYSGTFDLPYAFNGCKP